MLQRRSTSRRAVLGLASMGAGAALVMGAITAPAGADSHSAKEPFTGNPKCAESGYDNGFKIEATGHFPPAGTYTVGDPNTETEGDAGDFEVTISYSSSNPLRLDFESNSPVDAVIMKEGNGGYIYTYDPPVTQDTDLKGHRRNKSLSHVTFCWNDEEPPPPTTTTTVVGEPTTTTTVLVDDELPPAAAPPAPPVTGEPTFTG